MLRKDDGRGIAYYKTSSGWEPLSDETISLSYDAVADQWTAVHSNDSVEIYNALGQLQSITNRAGQSTSLTYVNGKLDTISAQGRTLSLTYDANNKIESVTDPAGYAVNYLYDLVGNLEFVKYPDATPLNLADNPTLQYHYEDLNNASLVTGITDELGTRFSTYTYDAEGRATLTKLAGDVNSFQVTYNTDGTVSVLNPLLRQSDYTFTVDNSIRKLTVVAGQPTTMCGATTSAISYDANGFVDTMTDEEGIVTDYTYDARGLVTSKTEAFGTADASPPQPHGMRVLGCRRKSYAQAKRLI